MIRGSTRTLALSSVVLFASAGCDALTVRSFAGSILQMTLEGAQVTPPGTHLEIWARDQYNDIIRLQPFYDESINATTPGLMIRQAIAPTDPCMIDDKGNLLTTAAAYPTSISYSGITQTPEQQAQQRVLRIQQLNPAGMPPLLAVVPWDEHVEPTVAANTAPADRKAACDAYRNVQPPTTYVPNPDQITAPLHGTVYGFVGYSTNHPPAGYDGLRIDSPIALKGIRELWLTDETAPAGATGDFVDPRHRGPTALEGLPDAGGRDVVHFDLTGPGGSGTAALLVNLDTDPIQY